MLLSTTFFISRYKILIQFVRPSHISPYTTRTINTLITLFHKLLISKTTHSIISEFFLNLLVIHIYLTLCLQDEGNMTMVRLAFTARIPQDIFVT
jgi:hypothetical protein